MADRASPRGPRGPRADPGGIARRLRGIALDIAPVIVFTTVFAVTGRIEPAVGAALLVGIAAVLLRLVRRRPPWGPVGGLAITGAGAALVALSGDPTAFFLPKMLGQAVVLVGGVVLTLIELPPTGLAAGLLARRGLSRQGLAWRRCRTRRRGHQAASLVLLVSPLTTSTASLPLYLDGNVLGLGVVDLLRPAVLVLAALAAWRIHTRMTAGHRCA